MSVTAGRETAVSQDAGPGVGTLFLLEDQPDHSALIREALEDELPGLRVTSSAGEPPADCVERPDIVLVALSTDLGEARRRILLVHQERPGARVFLLRGAVERWKPADVGHADNFTILDKRGGPLFLQRLTEALRDALRGGEGAAPGSARSVDSRAMSVQEDAPGSGPGGPGSSSCATPSRARGTAEIVGLLALELDAILARAAPLAGLFGGRYPGELAARCYAANLEQELGKARAVACRLGTIGGPGKPFRKVRATPAQILILRGPAWRLFAPGGVEVVVDAAAPGPEADLHLEVFGAAIDGLVGELLAAAQPEERLLIDCGLAIADEVFCAARPGLQRGRCARISARLEGPVLASGERRTIGIASMNWTQVCALAVIEAHGGFLGLTAGPAADRISQVEVLVPAAPLPRPASTRDGEARPASILFIDDDAAVRGVGLDMLRAAGWAAQGTASGEEALALVASGCRYDLILLDLTLPGLSGEATFERIRAVDPQVLVVLVSGSATEDTLRALFDRGLLGFVPKPFSMRQFTGAVRAALGAPS